MDEIKDKIDNTIRTKWEINGAPHFTYEEFTINTILNGI